MRVSIGRLWLLVPQFLVVEAVGHGGLDDGLEPAVILNLVVNGSDDAVGVFHSVAAENLRRVFGLPVIQSHVRGIDEVAE